jgi:AcrR family transcriptional regulator
MSQPARRTQAERSGEMRERLAKAAYDVIAERGHSAFRTAPVLTHAAVSQGAMLHHFPTKESLTLAAIDHALNLGSEATRARIDAAGRDVRAILQAMAEDFQDFFMGNRFWVSLDITMDAAKDATVAPAIREIVAQARRPVYQQWESALTRAGWDAARAGEVVAMTAALISGYAIRSLWTDDTDALNTVLDHLFGFLTRQAQ